VSRATALCAERLTQFRLEAHDDEHHGDDAENDGKDEDELGTHGCTACVH
jgi:hypothetical protein